jgi:DNA-binding transcriptional LysR family regulator
MNFRQLEAFRAVMLSGSASRAAEMLDISQPAVSRAIMELERSTSLRLFDRVLGRLVPTAEGRALYQDVANAFGEIDRLKGSAARIRDFGSGQLRVASLSSLGTALVPLALQRFHARLPETRLSYQVQSSSVVRDLVASGQFDLGLVADEADLRGVVHEPFASYAGAIALLPDHPLADREVIVARDLEGEPFIALANEDTARRKLESVLKAAKASVDIVMETPSSVTVAQLVKAGMGIGLLNPVVAFGGRTIDPDLVVVPFAPDIHFRKLLLFPPDRQKSKLVREFVKELMAVRNDFTAVSRSPKLRRLGTASCSRTGAE